MADNEQNSDAETKRRAEAALKRMLDSPKPHKDSKLGRMRESTDHAAQKIEKKLSTVFV